MNILGTILARYGSKHIDGKPLMDTCGKPMIHLVYEQAKTEFGTIVVDTQEG